MYEIVNVSSKLPRSKTKKYPIRNPDGVVLFMPHHAAAWDLNLIRLALSHIQPDPSRGKGEWPGVAYDYVIPEEDNEYIYQTHERHERGYHCGANGMNTKAISACLFGNFEDRPPKKWQIDKLVWLIIETNNADSIERGIVWHGDQKPTLCPGRYFPKEEVIKRVASFYNPEPEEPDDDPQEEEPDDDPQEEEPDTIPGGCLGLFLNLMASALNLF